MGESTAEASVGGQGGGSGFLARCLAQNRGSRPAQQRSWRDCIYEQIRMMQPQGRVMISGPSTTLPRCAAAFAESTPRASARTATSCSSSLKSQKPFRQKTPLTQRYVVFSTNPQPSVATRNIDSPCRRVEAPAFHAGERGFQGLAAKAADIETRFSAGPSGGPALKRKF